MATTAATVATVATATATTNVPTEYLPGGTKYVDHLTEDDPLPNQNYVCISFLSPEKIMNTSMRGLKIRGVFRTREEANDYCKELQTRDPDFDIHVGEMGKWLPWNPDPNDATDQIYKEKELNDLMDGYKKNLEQTKRMEQQRKNDMIKQAAQQQKPNITRDKLRKKLEAKQKKQSSSKQPQPEPESKQLEPTEPEQKQPEVKQPENITQKDAELKKQEEMAKEERNRLNTIQQVVNEKEEKITSIDEKLERFQKLYAKLNSN